jgi:hypothetical protein
VSTPPDSRGDWIRRVEGLLAKAASTDFPAEAEALVVKAQALMSRHAIDEAVLDASKVKEARVVTDLIDIEPPYAGPKSSLLGGIARANGCRVVIVEARDGRRRCAVVGHQGDLERAHVLFASLTLQGTRAMLRAPAPPWDGPRRFRHAFLLGFAQQITRRLNDAARAVHLEAVGSSSVSLVLRSRSDEVDAAVQSQFSRLRPARMHASSRAGAHDGRQAADAADLGRGGVRGSGPAVGRGGRDGSV